MHNEWTRTFLVDIFDNVRKKRLLVFEISLEAFVLDNDIEVFCSTNTNVDTADALQEPEASAGDDDDDYF